jgi:hypothetical protein
MRTPRAIAASAVSVGLLAAIAAAPAASGAAARATPRCHTRDVVAIVTQADHGAGNAFAYVVLVNATPAPCTIAGYPGLQLATAAGRPLARQRTVWRGPHHALLVQPGESAKALLHWSDVPTGSASTCGPTAGKLKITPPDETTSIVLPWLGGIACNGRLDVRAFRPGSAT